MRLTPLPSFSRSLHPSASFSLRSSDVAPSNIALARRFRPRSSRHQRASDALCRAPFRPSLPELHRAPGSLPPAPRQRSRLSLIQSAFHQRVPLPESVSGPGPEPATVPSALPPKRAGFQRAFFPETFASMIRSPVCRRLFTRGPPITRCSSTSAIDLGPRAQLSNLPSPDAFTTVSRRESNSGDRAPFEAPPVEVSLARGSICYRIRAPSTAIAHREASPQLVLPRTSPVANVMQ